MPGRYISNRAAIDGLNMIRKGSTTHMERMRVSINLNAHGGGGSLQGKISVFPKLKQHDYCAVLYTARSPFDLEVGHSPGGNFPPVSRSDRRWSRSPGEPYGRYPTSFYAAPIKRTGSFEIKFPQNFLNGNLYQSIVVISGADYMRPAAKTNRTFVFNGKGENDSSFFGRYMEFLRHNRAYLSDFMLTCLVANPTVLLTAHLADNCVFDFK